MEIQPLLWKQTVEEVTKSLGIALAPEWSEVLYDPTQTKLIMGGEGSAKSFHAGLYLTCKIFYDQLFGNRAGLYWVVGQDFEDARKEFDYVCNLSGDGFLQRLDMVESKTLSTHKDQQCILKTKTGQEIITVSAYDFSKLGRDTIQGAIGAEFSRWQDQEIFDRIIGRIRRQQDNESWAFMSGSYESSYGWLPDMIKQASGPNNQQMRAFKVPSWANLFFYPQGFDSPAIQMEKDRMSPERFMERFGGEPAPPKGIIFQEFRNQEHVDRFIKPDLTSPVYLFIDPGDLVYCVLFVQLVNGEVRILDELYKTHWTHSQVVTTVMSNPLYGLVRGGTIDIGAKQAHMGMPRPVEEWYKDTGIMLQMKKQPVEDTIERVRVALSQNPSTGRPRLRIRPECQGIISEMGGGPPPYQGGGPWMRITTKQGFGPPRDKNDHACKALGYGLASHQYSLITPLEESYGDEAATYMRFRRRNA